MQLRALFICTLVLTGISCLSFGQTTKPYIGLKFFAEPNSFSTESVEEESLFVTSQSGDSIPIQLSALASAPINDNYHNINYSSLAFSGSPKNGFKESVNKFLGQNRGSIISNDKFYSRYKGKNAEYGYFKNVHRNSNYKRRKGYVYRKPNNRYNPPPNFGRLGF